MRALAALTRTKRVIDPARWIGVLPPVRAGKAALTHPCVHRAGPPAELAGSPGCPGLARCDFDLAAFSFPSCDQKKGQERNSYPQDQHILVSVFDEIGS